MFTSYYGQRLLEPGKYYLVQISNSRPKGVRVDAILQEAVPDWNTIVVPFKGGRLTEDEYISRYRRGLDLRREDIRQRIVAIKREAGEREVVFLCYESPNRFCHRHIFATWLKDNFQIDVSEMSAPGSTTGSLF